jgi:hypothetical protein
MKTMTGILVVWVTGLSTAFAASTAPSAESKAAARPVRVVLIGASIGKAWNLPELPARTGSVGYEFEALQAWQYDKSDALDEVLMRPERKFHFTRTYLKGFFEPSPRPVDVIILKECSAYFPGDISLKGQKEFVEQWVREIREKNIRVMLATAVPVTRQRAAKDPGKQESVLAFNDWAREYARKNGFVLLDLEAATRTDDRERYLRDDFAVDDGSHLNRKAYDLLDKRMLEAVCAAWPTGRCS